MTWESRLKSRWTPLKITETAVVLAILAVIGWVVFAKGQTLPYMFTPLFIWIAFRFDQFVAACFTLLLLCLSIWGAVEGVYIYHDVSPNIFLLLTQVYISIVSVMTLLLNSVISQRNTAFADLKSSNEHLQHARIEREQAEEARSYLATIVQFSDDAIIGKSPE